MLRAIGFADTFLNLNLKQFVWNIKTLNTRESHCGMKVLFNFFLNRNLEDESLISLGNYMISQLEYIANLISVSDLKICKS